MFDNKERQGENSATESSFSLDFFDSDELSKIDLGKYHIESKVQGITHVSISLPRKCIRQSLQKLLKLHLWLLRIWSVLVYCGKPVLFL